MKSRIISARVTDVNCLELISWQKCECARCQHCKITESLVLDSTTGGYYLQARSNCHNRYRHSQQKASNHDSWYANCPEYRQFYDHPQYQARCLHYGISGCQWGNKCSYFHDPALKNKEMQLYYTSYNCNCGHPLRHFAKRTPEGWACRRCGVVFAGIFDNPSATLSENSQNLMIPLEEWKHEMRLCGSNIVYIGPHVPSDVFIITCNGSVLKPQVSTIDSGKMVVFVTRREEQGNKSEIKSLV